MRHFLMMALLALPSAAWADDPPPVPVFTQLHMSGCFSEVSPVAGPSFCTEAILRIATMPDGRMYEGLLFPTLGCSTAAPNLISSPFPYCENIQTNLAPGYTFTADWRNERFTSISGAPLGIIEENDAFFGDPNDIASLTTRFYWTADLTPGTPGYEMGLIKGTFTTTPEPATMILMGTGLAALAAARRRRRPQESDSPV